ncbi:MAG: ThuA domain-containing protein [Candidatus Solibacter sp.]
MSLNASKSTLFMGCCAAALCAGAIVTLQAQQGRGGGRGGGSGPGVFAAVDANRDGSVTRDELKAAFAKWLADGDTAKTGALTQDQLVTVLGAALPQAAPPAGGFGGGGRGPQAQNQTPKPEDVERMMAALPEKAPAKPKQARKVLVLSKCAGFVHSCIPLVGKTVEELGKKTGAWTATVTYDPAAINAENLKQYDLLVLNNTTGNFLDDPNDAVATAARKKALLEFVRGGKGLAGIHAASDSYHQTAPAATSAAPPAFRGASATLAGQMMTAGDTNKDAKLDRGEMNVLADSWYEKIDTEKAGTVNQQNFAARFAGVLPPPPPPAPRVIPQGRDREVPTWPEFNKIIGGMFKWHWLDPQLISVKIDDPKSPITAVFKGQGFDIHDETYTFGMEVYSRTNLHVLTSVDYDKMSDTDKAKEEYPRADHDYGLSWIRPEGKGRIFYEAHGHNEKVYAITPMLEHVLAGMQYAIGDLQADDSPSRK